jgi:hypothetical protein
VKIWATDNQHLKHNLDCNDIAEVKKGLFRRVEYNSPITCVLFHPKKEIFFTFFFHFFNTSKVQIKVEELFVGTFQKHLKLLELLN